MNIFQSINNALAAGTLAALIAGSFKPAIPPSEQPVTFLLFALFLLLIRLKIHLDDHKYFKTADPQTPHFQVGFLVGLVSWILWSYSAYSIGNLREAVFWAGIALLLSTLWIVAVALRAGAYTEQYVWLGTNALYVIVLWTIYRRDQFVGDWFTWMLFALLLAVVAYDYTESNPFAGL